jgi:hypothetical protein
MALAARRSSVTLYSRAYARDRSRESSPPLGSRSLPPTASAWSALLFGVEQKGSLHDGVRRARSSKLTARAETHRDRNGLTFPTSSAEQIASPERSLSRARSRRLAEAEVCTSHPHTVHDDSQLSGYCYACFLRPYAFGELCAPRAQNGPLLRDPKMRVRSFVESVAHQLVTALADIARPVDLARLIYTRRQSQVRRYGPRVLEPCRIVNRRLERQAYDWPYARDCDQTPADLIFTRYLRKLTVQ